MTLQTAENGKKSKVRPVYTVDQVRDMVAALYEQKPSYRRIAKEDFGGKVTFGDVQRIIHGIEPKSPQKRGGVRAAGISDGTGVFEVRSGACDKEMHSKVTIDRG